MPRSKGRTGRPYRRLRAQLIASPAGRVCWICGHAIDLTLPPRHPLSWSLDHADPLSRGGAEVDPRNARPAHLRCNSSRGNRMSGKKSQTSRAW
ncbi:HNH endonuclease [Planobispora rosea]|uniref:HNH endonuclease n=1 Tax=Planobispora rosea TaxID=35762 RepID=UPI000A043244|nr:HNH endonuclease [Planobispora rosea]